MQSWRHEGALPFDATDSASIIRAMKQRARQAAFAEPFRAVTLAIPETRRAWANYLPYWPTQGWPAHPARGRVTLAGDAAHPMTPRTFFPPPFFFFFCLC